MTTPSRSVTTTSSHHIHASSKLRVVGWERSVGSPSVQRGQEMDETSEHASGDGSEYKDAPEDWAFSFLCYFVILFLYHVMDLNVFILIYYIHFLSLQSWLISLDVLDGCYVIVRRWTIWLFFGIWWYIWIPILTVMMNCCFLRHYHVLFLMGDRPEIFYMWMFIHYVWFCWWNVDVGLHYPSIMTLIILINELFLYDVTIIDGWCKC